MEQIRIILPPRNLCCLGSFAVVNMATEEELARGEARETITILTDACMDIGIASVRLGAPAVRLRFIASPGKIYRLLWMNHGFGAGMGVLESG